MHHNPRRATAHWRQLLDKVFLVQTLVGLEESVNSWLPSDATGAPASSQISSRQLAELIRDAPKLTPLKTKVAALVEPEHCAHVEERLTAASNQYQTWAICWDCHSRWKLPMEWHRTASPKKPRAKASASSSAAEAFKKEIQGRMEAEMRAEFAHKVQEQALNSQSMMLQLRSTHAEVDQMRERLSNQAMANLEEMGQLQCAIEEDTRMKAQLSQMRWNQEVQQVMMNEYATMAMGQRFQDHPDFHHNEMHMYAERILRAEEETQRESRIAEALRMESQEEALARSSRMVRKPPSKSPTRSRAASQPRRSG
jgi:hypothetical protein